MTTNFIQVTHLEGIATLSLNRPDKRNALHAPLVKELLQTITQLSNDTKTRVLILKGQGEHFCAGGDIAAMQQIALGSEDKNYDDAQLLADLIYQLYIFPKPTIVLAQGMTLGGGMGLLAASDIVIAAENAHFGLPEVKIGLAPSIVSPYMINAMGERAAHYYFLTGDSFGAEEAYRIGLVHQIVELDQLQAKGMELAQTLLLNSPQALSMAKRLIRHVAKHEITLQLAQRTAEHLAELRQTPEAQEGLKAFLEKRKPNWRGKEAT